MATKNQVQNFARDHGVGHFLFFLLDFFPSGLLSLLFHALTVVQSVQFFHTFMKILYYDTCKITVVDAHFLSLRVEFFLLSIILFVWRS